MVKCLEAYCDYVEQQGEITFPLTVKPRGKELENTHLAPSPKGANKLSKAPVKAKRSRLRDIKEVSLTVLDTIPAGWPVDRATLKPKRIIQVAKGRFPEGSFGLDVTGTSMNAAKGKFGPILDGETVVLLPPDLRKPEHGDIVAALCDSQTTLKRLICKPEPCTLRAESTNPEFANDIKPAHELVIQGVVVGKL